MNATPVRRTQEERRATTRAKLLEAAAACLLERGYAATTVSEVQERAGVARGTLLHHFPTKVELMVAATEHVVDQRVEQFRLAAAEIPADEDRLDALVDLAWRDLSSPVFFTAMELWMAARTDAELRSAVLVLEERLFQRMRECYAGVLGDDAGELAVPLEFTIDVLTGLSITAMLSGKLGPRQPLLDKWKQALRLLVEGQS
jgi:AcrR family transcriptional regulator